ncbi:MAG: hypothetical protein ABIA93_02970 [Candidatus Woesearchaeota archaeon]
MRKGQAALEFLTTYGWAMLIILVMIGALAYFGVLNPYDLLPDKCITGSGFTCVEGAADGASDQVFMRIANNLGMDIKQVNIQQTGGSITGCLPTPAAPALWKANEIMEFNWTGPVSCTFSSGERIKLQFEISYTPVGKTYPKTVNGELLTKSN